MYVTVTTIPVASDEQAAKMAENFKKNSPDLKKFDGFIRFEFWKQEGEIKAVAHWASKESLDHYLNSEMFHQHHGHQASNESGGGQGHGHDHAHGEGHGEGHGHNGPKIDYYDAEVFA